jgi:SP family arabinose:H+ symporter-like MFS transporter
MVYIFGFSIGLGPVTWVLLAEIYPLHLREQAMSIALFVNWLCVFFVLWTFPFLLSSVKILGSFGLYGLLCGMALLFVVRMIPETKQKNFFQILKIFQDKFK